MEQFIEDFVNIIVLGTGHNYDFKENEATVISNQIYRNSEVFRIAIHFLDRALESEYADLYFEMKNGHFLNSESYERFARSLAEKYFPEGFDLKYFLIFCLTLSIMAIFFYNCEPHLLDAPALATKNICQFLQRYNVQDVEWSAMGRSAKKIVNMLQDSVNELIPPYSSPMPDETGHKVQVQEEIRHGSGNVENNFEQQKAYACSKIEKYLEEYVFSKRRSAIGLCSSKEFESLSADNTSHTSVLKGNKLSNRSESEGKLRSGTSNVVPELILTITDIKMKMDLLRKEISNW